MNKTVTTLDYTMLGLLALLAFIFLLVGIIVLSIPFSNQQDSNAPNVDVQNSYDKGSYVSWGITMLIYAILGVTLFTWLFIRKRKSITNQTMRRI